MDLTPIGKECFGHELQACGVELVFLNHETTDSPESQLLLQMQGVIAEYERGKIMERCRRSKLDAYFINTKKVSRDMFVSQIFH